MSGSDLRDGPASIGVDPPGRQGIEAFYNAAVTPWFSVTGDLQVVRPVVSDASTAVSTAVRTKVAFQDQWSEDGQVFASRFA